MLDEQKEIIESIVDEIDHMRVETFAARDESWGEEKLELRRFGKELDKAAFALKKAIGRGDEQ